MIIPIDRILLDSSTQSKRALISEIAGLLPAMDPDQVLELIMAREQLGSTGIGHGVAIPHGRMADLAKPVIAVARHTQGIDFDAIDGNLVHIVVMLLVPDDDSGHHLELLAKLARLLQNQVVRHAILQAGSAEDISALFADEEEKKG